MIRYVFVILICIVFTPLQAEQRLPEDEYDCFIVPSVLADVGSPVRGVVARLLVDRGDTVTQDQPIAELESGVEKIMLAHAHARADMSSELGAREADLALAKLELARVEDLHLQELAPAQQRDESRAREKIAQAGMGQALENRSLVQIELQRSTLELEQRTLRSPTDGVVVEQFISPGELIYDEPIMSIAKLDPLRVEVVLPADLFGSVQVGGEALITPELDSTNRLTGIVDAVDAILDTRSATFGVRLMLPNKDLAITAGQKCIVDFLAASASTSATTDLELAEEAE